MPVPSTEGVDRKPTFPPRPAGWYRMQFVTYTEKDPKPEAKVQAQYAAIELQHEDSEQKAWANLSFDPEWLWKLAQFKAAVGMPDAETNLEDYQGTWLEVFLKVRKYKDKNTNEMKEINDCWEFKALPDTVVGSGSPKAKAETLPTAPDDDLPF
jgi:hypothetical protein